MNDVESEWFETNVGVRQGATLSPLLFNIFINNIVEKVKETEIGTRFEDETVSILMFVDDMVLLGENEPDLHSLLAQVREYCDEWKLQVNVDKT